MISAVSHSIPPRYAFERLTQVLRHFNHPPLERVWDGAWWRTLRQGDSLALIRAEADDKHLTLQLIDHKGPVDADRLYEHSLRMLGFDQDQTDFYALAEQDAALQSLIGPLWGLPLQRSENAYEALILTIIEQHIAWKAAQQAQQRLVIWGQQYIDHAERRFYALPSPAQLATADPAELSHLKITFKRVNLLIELAQGIVSGQIPLKDWAAEGSEALYQGLLNLKGIGHWTAAVTVSRALGLHPYVPHNDVALQAAVNLYFHGESGRSGPQRLLDTLGRYGDFAGLAGHYTIMRWVQDRYPILED